MNTQIAETRKYLEIELKRILAVIIRDYYPEKIILFGSLASGNIREHSDIDLVIIKDTRQRFIDRLHKVRLITRPEVGVDFIVYTSKEIENMKKEKRRFLIKEVLKKGKLLYEKTK